MFARNNIVEYILSAVKIKLQKIPKSNYSKCATPTHQKTSFKYKSISVE